MYCDSSATRRCRFCLNHRWLSGCVRWGTDGSELLPGNGRGSSADLSAPARHAGRNPAESGIQEVVRASADGPAGGRRHCSAVGRSSVSKLVTQAPSGLVCAECLATLWLIQRSATGMNYSGTLLLARVSSNRHSDRRPGSDANPSTRCGSLLFANLSPAILRFGRDVWLRSRE